MNLLELTSFLWISFEFLKMEKTINGSRHAPVLLTSGQLSLAHHTAEARQVIDRIGQALAYPVAGQDRPFASLTVFACTIDSVVKLLWILLSMKRFVQSLWKKSA